VINISPLSAYRYRPMTVEDIVALLRDPELGLARDYLLTSPTQARALRTCAEVLFAASELARTEKLEHFTLPNIIRRSDVSRATLYRFFGGMEGVHTCGHQVLSAFQHRQRQAVLQRGASLDFPDLAQAYARVMVDSMQDLLADYAGNVVRYRRQVDIFRPGHLQAARLLGAAARRAGLLGEGAEAASFSVPSMALVLHIREAWLADPEAMRQDATRRRLIETFLDMQHSLIASAQGGGALAGAAA
jgi:AcrR family transcriptional regulator